MRRFLRISAVGLGLTTLGLLISLMPPQTARGGAAQLVSVVNTPLPITGAVKADITNAVKADITNTPTVKVSSFPPVNVNFPASLGVANPAKNGTPIPLQTDTQADRGARNSFLVNCSNIFGGNPTAGCDLLNVPAGQIAVIETVTGTCQCQGLSVVLTSAELVPLTGEPFPNVGVPLFLNQGFPSFDGTFNNYAWTLPVRLYYGAGTNIVANAQCSTNSVGGTLSVSASGYYVPAQ